MDTGTHSEVGSPKKITKKFKLDPGRIAQDLQDTGVGHCGREKSVLGKETRFFINFLLKIEVQPYKAGFWPNLFSWKTFAIKYLMYRFNDQVWSKAVDSEFNVQPESFKNIWNLRGLISNAYSRLNVSD